MTINTVWVGDSIMAGTHLGSPTTERFSTLCCTALTSLGHTVVQNNIAVGSATLDSANQGTTADGLFDSGKDRNVCIVMIGINDMGPGGESGASFEGRLKTWCQSRQSAGFRMVVCTVLPDTDAPTVTRVKDCNTLLRSDNSFYSGLADTGAGSGQTMGVDSAPSDATLYSDGVHPTALGNTLIAPYVTAAIILAISGAAHFATVFAGVAR